MPRFRRDAALRWHVSRSIASRKKDVALVILIV
jgi:hypothetical protein